MSIGVDHGGPVSILNLGQRGNQNGIDGDLMGTASANLRDSLEEA